MTELHSHNPDIDIGDDRSANPAASSQSQESGLAIDQSLEHDRTESPISSTSLQEFRESGLAINQSQERGKTGLPISSTSLQDRRNEADAGHPRTLRVEQGLRDFTARFGMRNILFIDFRLRYDVCCHSDGYRCTKGSNGRCYIDIQRESEKFSPSIAPSPEQCACLNCVHEYLCTHVTEREMNGSIYSGSAIYALRPSWASPAKGREQEAHSWWPLKWMWENPSNPTWKWVKSSFRPDRNDYRCPEDHCRKKFTDFRGMLRHYQATHCTQPTRYPCTFFNCKYSGDNGFVRKDKLQSHLRKVHGAQTVPSNTPRRLLPAPANVVSPSTSGQSSDANMLENV